MCYQQMMKGYMDLHIHLGRDLYRNPVKITASDSLTVLNVIKESVTRKGLDIIGIIDCLSPAVLTELEMYLKSEELIELTGGGLSWQGDITIIPGAELEVFDKNCQGPLHVLCYFPFMSEMKKFSAWCSKYMTNLSLSTQRIYVDALKLQKRVKEGGGWFIPAHVFTPFKSVYGKGVHTYMEEVFDLRLIDAVELGLSSDTLMADMVPELHQFPFLTNSYAHSLEKIAREHQIVNVSSPSFSDVEQAIKCQNGRCLTANIGMPPQLGKYYHSVCSQCLSVIDGPSCDNHPGVRIIRGVWPRTEELAKSQEKIAKSRMISKRPFYRHEVPLSFLPGIGHKTLNRLINRFGSEMAVIHDIPLEDLSDVLTEKTVYLIDRMRHNKLSFTPGGGGVYGKMTR